MPKTECPYCGRDNTGYEHRPCSDDCPQYWEEVGKPHPQHPDTFAARWPNGYATTEEPR